MGDFELTTRELRDNPKKEEREREREREKEERELLIFILILQKPNSLVRTQLKGRKYCLRWIILRISLFVITEIEQF